MLKVLPVIHYLDEDKAIQNAEIVLSLGCDGIFIISMDRQDEHLCAIAKNIKNRWPDKFVGVNHLTKSPLESLKLNKSAEIDGTWSDYSILQEGKPTADALTISQEKTWMEFFAAVAFKYQKAEKDPGTAAVLVQQLGLIPTTSGSATGKAAPVEKLHLIRQTMPDGPLAIASGITPDNAPIFAPYITHVLVATGISDDEYTFSRDKTMSLLNNLAPFRN